MTESQLDPKLSSALKRMLRDDYEEIEDQFSDWLEWMCKSGKDPVRLKPLERITADNYVDRLDQAIRLMVDYFGKDLVLPLNPDIVEDFLFNLDQDEIIKLRTEESYKESSKRKFANALKKYFEWQYHEGLLEYEWHPPIKFTDNDSTSAYRFTYEELGKILTEAKAFGSLPSYHTVSESERQKFNAEIAQRLKIPKEEITHKEWREADQSRHTYSLIAVGYDAGLAPIEVERAEEQWYDPTRQALVIPSEKACKKRSKELTALSDDAADALEGHLKERRLQEKYDGSNKIWLNREGNPYRSKTLCNLIRRVCDEAGIPTEDRAIRWYSLRHTLGRNMTAEGELSEASDQLRHNSIKTTDETYNVTPLEKLHTTLNRTYDKAERAANDPDYEPFSDEQHGDSPRGGRVASNRTSDETQTDGFHNRMDRDEAKTDPSKAVTRLGGGEIHTDTFCTDTPASRARLAREILDDSEN